MQGFFRAQIKKSVHQTYAKQKKQKYNNNSSKNKKTDKGEKEQNKLRATIERQKEKRKNVKCAIGKTKTMPQ